MPPGSCSRIRRCCRPRSASPRRPTWTSGFRPASIPRRGTTDRERAHVRRGRAREGRRQRSTRRAPISPMAWRSSRRRIRTPTAAGRRTWCRCTSRRWRRALGDVAAARQRRRRAAHRLRQRDEPDAGPRRGAAARARAASRARRRRRSRLLQQVLVEGLMLSTIGAVAGLLFARWATPLLVSLAPAGTPRLARSTTDWTVVLFTIAIAIACGVIVGIVPGLGASRVPVRSAIGDGGAARLGRPPPACAALLVAGRGRPRRGAHHRRRPARRAASSPCSTSIPDSAPITC